MYYLKPTQEREEKLTPPAPRAKLTAYGSPES
jgi:hypothetical protein